MTEPDEGSTADSAILTIPNAVSVVRLLLVPLFLWLLLVDDRIAAAGWLLGLIGATDWVDGYLARRLGQVSDIGKLLDPLADRLAVAAAVIGGLIAGVLPAWFAWALIVREALFGIGALYVGMAAGRKLAVRWLGKLATFVLYVAIPAWFVGVGTPWRPLEVSAWVLGVPALILYYAVGAQYLGDVRRILAEERARPPGGPSDR